MLKKEAAKDYQKLDGSQKKIAYAMLEKLKINPLPQSKGGYGHPLGNDSETGNLSRLFKLKARGSGIRIIYELAEYNKTSIIIVIGMREDI